MKEYQKVVVFISAIVIGYIIPISLSLPNWSGWIGVLLVFVIDMGISRIKYPDEMNTPEITKSEWMTYVGLITAIIFGIAFYIGFIDGGLMSLGIYLVSGGIIYFIWSTM